MAKRERFRCVGKMTLAELRRELDVISAWIRDTNEPKRARMREISREIEVRTARKAMKAPGTETAVRCSG